MSARPCLTGLFAVTLALGTLLPFSGVAAAKESDQLRDPKSGLEFTRVVSPADPTFTQLLGINDHRDIAGYHTNVPGNKGFTLKLPNSFADENFPSSAQTQVVGINNLGRTVGFYIDSNGNTHGFEKDRDFTAVDMPGTTFNQLLGINNRNQAAGYFQDAAGLQHGYIRRENGDFEVLGDLKLPSSQATGIDDDGDVVGFEQSSPSATTSEGFLRTREGVKVLQFPGSSFTQALGVNNHDEVVGSYTDANGTMHGFRYRDGQYFSIDVPGGMNTVINGVNDDGWVVGFFMDPNQNNNTIGVVGQPGS
jgi:probable HAF family extracellular repeat protein